MNRLPSLVTILGFAVSTLSGLSAPRPASAACADAAGFDPGAAGAWPGWGRDHSNSRFVAAGDDRRGRSAAELRAAGLSDAGVQAAGLSAADLPRLRLAWAFGFPGARSVMGQPTVFGRRVFAGADTGDVYALDAATGCPVWRFGAQASVRTAPVVAEVAGAWTLFFGDFGGRVYAVDAATGALKWKARADEHPAARISGSPQFLAARAGVGQRARLFVPVSSSEEGLGGNPAYACCTFRGSVVALDAATGARLWKTYTIARPPAATGPNRFGPSGAAVWGTPVVDVERGLLYVATGDAYSPPADPATDAVMALDLATGAVRWSRQGTAGDVWTVRCLRAGTRATTGVDRVAGDGAAATDGGVDEEGAGGDAAEKGAGGDVAEDCGPDQDFGAPPILVRADDLAGGPAGGGAGGPAPGRAGGRAARGPAAGNSGSSAGPRAGGRDLLVAGQKSGNVWAFDPATGALVWRTPLVEDTTQFGGKIVWGGAADASKVYFGLGTGGVAALRLADGARVWFTKLAPAATPAGAAAARDAAAAGPTAAGAATAGAPTAGLGARPAERVIRARTVRSSSPATWSSRAAGTACCARCRRRRAKSSGSSTRRAPSGP